MLMLLVFIVKVNIEPNLELARRLRRDRNDLNRRDFFAAVFTAICIAPLAYLVLWLFLSL